MPSEHRVLGYRGGVPAGGPKPVLPRISASQWAARVCGIGILFLLVIGITAIFDDGFFFGALIFLNALVWLVGVTLSVAGAFESKEVRSRVGLGCSMAVIFTIAWPALWFIFFLAAFGTIR